MSPGLAVVIPTYGRDEVLVETVRRELGYELVPEIGFVGEF